MATNFQSSEKKWGAGLSKAGFTILPNHLVAYNQFVSTDEQLNASEFFVLSQILVHWWSPTEMPFPSKSTVALRTGLSARQVQRTLGQLEKKGLIKRVARYGAGNSGRLSNAYDLSPLVAKLKELARQYPSLQTRTPKTIKAPAIDESFDLVE